jgi:hypothetical protein
VFHTTPAKRNRRGARHAEGDVLQQFGEIIVNAIQPILSALHTDSFATDTSQGRTAAVDILLQKFDDIAGRLQKIENRYCEGRSRTTDIYFKDMLEKRMRNIKEEIETSF